MAIFFDLPAIVENKNLVARENTPGKWIGKPYVTKLGAGMLLIAPEQDRVEDLVLGLNLQGWHRIYLSMVDLGSDTYTHVKLTEDLCFAGVRVPSRGNPKVWKPYEYIQEFYWKSADLTNQKLILRSPDNASSHLSNLVWIRCEEMSQEEISLCQQEKQRCVFSHLDIDPFVMEKFDSYDDTLMHLQSLKNSNTEICMIETGFHNDRLDLEGSYSLQTFWQRKWQGENFDYETLCRNYTQYGHRLGMKIYAGFRMSAANFAMGPAMYNKHFFRDNPQLFCKNRDGSTVNVCSYAYAETQDYMLNHLLTVAPWGFDGISLIFIRGMHLGFEQPVLDRFAAAYPGVDPLVLPISDPRLHGIWCQIMTEFLRKLRSRLDSKIKINILTDYGLITSKCLGLDVATWAKEGLIDSACQSDMETYEDLEGCLNPDGTIDPERYREKTLDTEILRRNFGTNPEKALAHAREYLDLTRYGIDVYHILPWVHTCTLSEYNHYVEQLQTLGATKFHAWNTNHMACNLPEAHTVQTIGNLQHRVPDPFNCYRTLSLFGSDISGFNPDWRG